MPLVSILIPSYNHGRFLPACIDSIRAQDFQDWEIVLVDDGSTDNSLDIAQKYAAMDSRIRALRNESNLGTYGTEQRALEASSGSLVAVMNSDDLWLPTKLTRQVSILNENPDLAYSYVLGWQVDEEGVVHSQTDVHADWPVLTLQQPLPYLLYENRILASGVLFRREGLRFDASCRYSGDWVALLEQSQKGGAACIAERLTLWRQHGANTYVRSKGQVLEEIRVRKAIFENASRWLSLGIEERLIERGLALNAINLQTLAIQCGDRSLAWKAACAAFKFHPNKKWLWKRIVACALPMSFLRRHFNPGQEPAATPTDVRSLAPLQINFAAKKGS